MIEKILRMIRNKLSLTISDEVNQTQIISDEIYQIDPPAGYISPETICKENSVEELCEKAENYFQNKRPWISMLVSVKP